MKPIYEPKGKAKEYGDYAINIYTGCPHGCTYCYAPRILHKSREEFMTNVQPRKNIVEEVRKQIEREHITDKLIHLCFTCDPYPTGCDTTMTREVIKVLKESGNHVQILTKGDGTRDMDLLDENDWYGVTLTCSDGQRLLDEPYAESNLIRLSSLSCAKYSNIKTWVSFEPVLDDRAVIDFVAWYFDLFDKVKVGKLNYEKSDINWREFGETIEDRLKDIGVDYYIKDSLREAMENGR